MHDQPTRSLRRAIAFATLLGCTLPALAAEQPARFDIPAQPLDSALTRFADQAGLRILFTSDDVAGLDGNALNGSFPPSQALQRLLQGSGYGFQFVDEKTLTLRKLQEGSGPVELDATSVTSSTFRGVATTEGTGSYTTGAMQTATKLPLSIRETPQSVTVVTRQRMDDQGMNNLDDVVTNTPGLTVRKTGPAIGEFFARGFEIENIMYDGLPTAFKSGFGATSHTLAAADLAIFDRVEIVRGSTGLMQGSGSPSAAINLVRKRPTAEPQVSVMASAGSWDNYRAELDASSALNASKTLRGRTVVAYQDKNSFQDVVGRENSLIYAIGELDIAPATTLTLGASNQSYNNTIGWSGLPVAPDGSDLHLPRSTYVGNEWEYWDQDNTTIFADVQHQFDNGWKLSFAASRMSAEMAMLGTYIDVYPNRYDQIASSSRYEDDQESYDLFARGPFNLLGRQHELVIGSSYRKEKFDGRSGNSIATATDMNLTNWDPGSVPKPVNFDFNQYSLVADTRQKSTYITTRLNVTGPLKLILGGRLDWYKFELYSGNPAAGLTYADAADSINRHLTKYAGLVYDLSKNHSVYVSYTDIFKPQNAIKADSSLISPIVGKNYEVGIKGEYFDGTLNASAALFRIDQENRAKRLTDQSGCPSFPTIPCSEAAGEVRSEGLELELNGALTKDWQLAAGYTFTEAKYKKDTNPTNEGRLFDTDQPRHQLKLATSYQLPGGFRLWRIGGSVNWQNRIYNKGAGYLIEQDAYAVTNLMIGYKPTSRLDLRLNMNNVFDKTYYQSINIGTWSSEASNYGEPRSFMLTANYHF